MKILILANNDVGLYKFRKELIQELISQGHKVVVSLPDGQLIPDIKRLGVKVIFTKMDRRGINPLTDLVLMMRYLRMGLTLKPDLVITYTIKPNIYGGMVCSLLRIPYAVNITGLGTAFQTENMIKKLVCLLYRISCKRAKEVFFENVENKEIFLKNHLVKERQVYLLNGAGVNLDEYPYIEYPDEKGEIRFLFIGRVMKEKGIDELFAAMRLLHQEGINCSLDVLGGYEEDYSAKIKKYETEGWLHYYGYQKDVRPFIARCHCFVLPSWHEGMANTNLECAASGRPLITSSISGCKEAVLEERSGLLCEKKNINSLYSAMKKFLELPFHEKVIMGQMGRKHMEDMFDKRKIVFETIKSLSD